MILQTHKRAIVPINPAVPSTTPYGLDALNLVPSFSGKDGRSLYRDYNDGEQAPPFVTKDENGELVPIKRWYIVADKPLVSGYYNSASVWVPKTYSVEFLAFLNLPGNYEYPQAVIPPSGAYMLFGEEKRYIPADSLSTYQEARTLQTELAAAGYATDLPFETVLPGPYAVYFDITERRRMWNVKVGDSKAVASALMRDKNSRGVGSPGRWSKPTDSAYPIWIPNVPASATEWNVMPEEPVPQRRLLPNERVAVGPFGAKVWVEGDSFSEVNVSNADIMAEIRKIVNNAPSGGSTELPAAAMNSIMHTEQIVRKIAQTWAVDIGSV